MSRKYFGTDGVRGRVGQHPMTVDFALRLASAAARVLAPEGGTVLIGKDTRLSGYMFEAALEAGFVAAGVDALLIGPLPTPGIAYMTQRFRCDFGVVISASHNLYDDNGIKFFDASGAKLSDELEAEIERRLDETPTTRESRALGRATRVDKSRTQYQDFCRASLPTGVDLSGDMLALARKRLQAYAGRCDLQCEPYSAPLAPAGFDLIVISYALSMMNPGFDAVLDAAARDLAPGGRIAIVDFHDTPFRAFRRWMGINHVRLEGQLRPALAGRWRHHELRLMPAWFGLWRRIQFIGEQRRG